MIGQALDAAIVGVGATPFPDPAGRSDAELARDAVLAALADAGLQRSDVDGLVTLALDHTDPILLSHQLSLGDLHWFSLLPYGGGQACGAVQDAALAVTAGLASVVVVYRAANLRSASRPGQLTTANLENPWGAWSNPFGLLTPAHRVALWFHRYMYEHGLQNADLAPVSLAARQFAATNPNARFYGRPLSFDEHQEAPWVAEPVLRVPDCCLESDAGVALVVTTGARARDLRPPAVAVAAAARGMAAGTSMMENYYRDSITSLPDLEVVASQLWTASGLGPGDIDAAMLYDSFSPVVLVGLEAMGFCSPGEGAAFVADGTIGRGGALPVNPHGGQLAEGYVHGFTGIAEAVSQLRGTAVNQIDDVQHVLCTSGTGLPSSGLILSRP